MKTVQRNTLAALLAVSAAVLVLARLAPELAGRAPRGPDAAAAAGEPADALSAPAGDADAARDAAPAAPGAGFYSAPVGRRFVYQLSGASAAKLELGFDGQTVEGSLEHRVAGRMEVSVAARAGDEIVAVVRFPDAAVEAAAGGRRERDAALEAAVARPCQVRLRDDGRLLGFRFEDSVAPAARNWVRSQVAAFRFEVERGDARQWEREETDPTGTARVRYVRETPQPGEQELRLTKTKLGYAAAIAAGDGVAIDVEPEVDARASGVLDPAIGWLEQARFDERLVVPVESVGLTTRVVSSGSLALVDAGWAEGTTAVDWDGPWGSVSGAEDVAAAAEDGEGLLRARLLEGATLEGLLAEIDALANAEPRDVAGLMDARHRLAELLVARPEAVERLGELVATMSPATADVALGAAGAAGTEPAQRLLVRVLEDRSGRESVRQSSLDSMFQLTRPIPEAYAAVDAVVSDRSQGSGLRANGMLLYGALTSMDPAAQIERAARVERLLALEDQARADGRLEHWLHALGNCGDERVLAATRVYLEGADPKLRRAAADALRAVEGSDAIGALARHANTDADVGVRRVCAGLLAARADEGAQRTVAGLLAREPEVEVRRAAVEALAKRARGDERARALLRFSAAHDASEELRARAAEAAR